MPGEQLVLQLRAKYPQLPIIVASGRGTGDMSASLRSLPLSAILPKPYSIDELRRVVESLKLKTA
jgi:DNA-binding response OmpR family regulator